MESAAGVAAGRGASPPMPSTRKEWRAVSNSGTEVHRGTGSVDVNFCSIDGSLDSELLQQRLHSVSRRREELQQLEIELRAQVVAKAEVLEMQKSFKAQVTEQANAAAELNEQLQERDQFIHELERRAGESIVLEQVIYIEPIMVVLHERELTCASRISWKHHTSMISALSISTTLKHHPLIWPAAFSSKSST